MQAVAVVHEPAHPAVLVEQVVVARAAKATAEPPAMATLTPARAVVVRLLQLIPELAARE